MTNDGQSRSAHRRSGSLTQEDLSVETYRVLDNDGEPIAPVPDLSVEDHRDLFRWMLLERLVDERMVKLQRRGQLGTYASGRGQEASIIGAASAIAPDDWLFGAGREASAMVMHGWSLRDLILFWRGVEDASRMSGATVFPIAISIGSHLPLAVGITWGMALSDAETIGLAYFGDGATSTGAFHEALNLAGVLGSPTVFYCQNNQYAISLPFERQTNARSVAQKAPGYGIEGIQVDGNDVLAVYDAVSTARDHARNGSPVLVESVTYRRDAHTTSDDPGRYRDDAEVEQWERTDPLDRYRAFLRFEEIFEAVDEEALREEITKEFDEALEAADDYEERAIEDVFTFVHDEMSPDLRRQYESFRAFLDEYPEAAEFIEQRPKG